MNIKVFTIFVSMSVCYGSCSSITASVSFKHENLSHLIHQETIECIEDAKVVGFLSLLRIPLVRTFVIYSFYVYSEFRNKGYGTKLLNYACEYIQQQDACRIYIQPGPFELSGYKHVDNGLNMKQLVKLYSKCGFQFVGKTMSFLANILYVCVNIKQDSQYLMIKIVND